MSLHEERREGPRESGKESKDVLFQMGQISGSLEAFIDRYEQDQTSAKEFRKYIRESHDGLNVRISALESRENKQLSGRISALESVENEQKEPRRIVRAGIIAAVCAAAGALATKLISKIHWG